jgi:PhzF family phenazine biosynthesis protein
MHAYKQVDVFTSVPFQGNPVGVVLWADDLSSEQMQRIATWTELAETTFVLKPTISAADYRLRIFNPVYELPFAGHPTLGSAYAALKAGLVPRSPGRLVQECKVGLVDLQVSALEEAPHSRVGLTMPSASFESVSESTTASLYEALGRTLLITPWLVDVGPRWLTVRLASADAVKQLAPDMEAVKRLSKELRATGINVFGEHPAGSPAKYEVRSFTPASGVDEDPVCGSGNGCVAAYLLKQGFPAENYVATQGCRVGRSGLVHIEYAPEGTIQLFGDCVVGIEGTIAI